MRGGRRPGMPSDARLIAPHDPAEIVAHPSRPGFTLQCRVDQTTNAGNWAETARGLAGALWFCPSELCQESLIRRHKFQYWKAQGSPDLGGRDVSEAVNDENIGVPPVFVPLGPP